MTRTLLRALLALVVVVVAGLAYASLDPSYGPASASLDPRAPEDPVPPVVPGVEPEMPKKPAPWDEKRLTAWLEESSAAPWLLYGLKGLLLVLGVWFLVLEFLIDDRRRHGMTPAGWGPWRANQVDPAIPAAFAEGGEAGAVPSRPRAWPTVVATPLAALGLGILFPVAVQVLLGVFLSLGWRPMGKIEFGIAAATLSFLPPALIVTLRRLRLGEGRLPAPITSLGLGLRFACIATLIVIPVQMLWGYLLVMRGTPLEIQEVVQAFADPAQPAQPWLIAFFGVFVAPFTEEAIFRGLLYPSLRGRVPGGPFGAAVLVALLFAVIHGNLMAFVPLFVLALVLCWVMERTNSLLACVTVHAIHNASSLAPMIGRLIEGSSVGAGS